MASIRKILIVIGFWILAIYTGLGQENYNGFTTTGGYLLDANGNQFVMRGINVPHAWHAKQSYIALNEIAKLKVNCVRIVWESHIPPQGLDSILQKCIDLDMIPMIELHDATGDTSAIKLFKLAQYFVTEEMKSIIKKYERFVLINIANEWGDNTLKADYWRDAYADCILLLRSQGIESVIVIDAPGWGQNSGPILTYGKDLIKTDPLHNLLFSVHMYGSWNKDRKIKNELKKAHSLSLPLIVGEFGYNYNKGNNNLGCKVNHKQILKTCSELNIGYLAWSWTGNNRENNWLDLVEYSDWKTLTPWGEEIFDSTFGIKETAIKASVFNY